MAESFMRYSSTTQLDMHRSDCLYNIKHIQQAAVREACMIDKPLNMMVHFADELMSDTQLLVDNQTLNRVAIDA